MANQETALPASPRLEDNELPRTTSQLRQAAAAAREGARGPCRRSTPSTTSARCCGPIGPVAVFGPNNFPFAFNSVAGGDFAAAIAAGNPVIAKANTRIPARRGCWPKKPSPAVASDRPAGGDRAAHLSHQPRRRRAAGRRPADRRHRLHRQPHAGPELKAAADAAGKPIYLELSSINPVVILPGALEERARRARRPVRHELPDGDRPVLHEPGPGDPACRRRRPRSSSPRW